MKISFLSPRQSISAPFRQGWHQFGMFLYHGTLVKSAQTLRLAHVKELPLFMGPHAEMLWIIDKKLFNLLPTQNTVTLTKEVEITLYDGILSRCPWEDYDATILNGGPDKFHERMKKMDTLNSHIAVQFEPFPRWSTLSSKEKEYLFVASTTERPGTREIIRRAVRNHGGVNEGAYLTMAGLMLTPKLALIVDQYLDSTYLDWLEP